MKRKLPLFLSAAAITIVLISPQTLQARENRGEKHILALGIDYNLNRGEDSFIPILYYNFLHVFRDSPWYVEAGFDNSVTSFATFAVDTDRFHAGLGPVFEYLIQAGSNYYVDGNSLENLMITGNDIGMKFFFEYKAHEYFTLGAVYHPKYYFYRLFSREDNTGLWIEPPNNHFEHELIAEVKVGKLEEKNFGVLKHGFLLRGRYSYAWRQGYGSFYDMQLNRGIFFSYVKSDIDKTQKVYGDLGIYYLFRHDVNLQIDIHGAYHYGVDRNNAEQIGTWFADHAIMPGYHNYEFAHDRYLIGRIDLGIPLMFWSSQLKPGFNALYMPRENRVKGIDNYSRTLFTSVSAEFFTMIGGMVPVWIKYAYGIDARRKQNFFSPAHRGNHELTVYFGAAF